MSSRGRIHPESHSIIASVSQSKTAVQRTIQFCGGAEVVMSFG